MTFSFVNRNKTDTRQMQYYIRLNKEKRLIVLIRQKKIDFYVTDNYQ